MEDEKYPYQKAWRHYRRRLRSLFVIFPLMFLPFIILAMTGSEIIKNALAFVGVVCFIALTVVSFNILLWKCPRCRKLYFRWWQRAQRLFAEECKNCGLKKYEGSSFSASENSAFNNKI